MTRLPSLRDRRILVVTDDTVGASMAGPAIRAVELGRALARRGASVVLTAPRVEDASVAGPVAVERCDTVPALEGLVARSDVVVGFSAVLARHPWIADTDATVVVDAYDPALFETLVRFAGAPVNESRLWARDAGAHMVAPLEWADAVLVASHRQRALVLGMLVALGRVTARVLTEDPTLERLVAVVPFGTSSEPPRPAGPPGPLRGPSRPFGPDHHVALWGGGLYDWLDPVGLVDALAAVGDERVVAAYLAGPHPTPAVGRPTSLDRTIARAAELDLGERVWFADRWVPYAERGAWLLDADVGVSLHHRHVETEFAFRTRILDYLWAGLPVVCTAGDVLSEVVADADLGWIVPPDDTAALADALERSAGASPMERAARRTRTAEVAATLGWDHTVAALADICATPALAADRRSGPESDGGRRKVARLLARAARRLDP